MKHTEEIAKRLFGDAYTIERRVFSDGDKRTVILHNIGWSPTCYVQVKVWVESSDVWIEYHEDDVRRHREILDYHGEYDPEADPIEYIWPDRNA